MNLPPERTVQDIIELEHKVAELEHSNSVISEELYSASKRIDQLEKQLAHLAGIFRDFRNANDSQAVPIDPPPHY